MHAAHDVGMNNKQVQFNYNRAFFPLGGWPPRPPWASFGRAILCLRMNVVSWASWLAFTGAFVCLRYGVVSNLELAKLTWKYTSRKRDDEKKRERGISAERPQKIFVLELPSGVS
jgi:hypothetical protein